MKTEKQKITVDCKGSGVNGLNNFGVFFVILGCIEIIASFLSFFNFEWWISVVLFVNAFFLFFLNVLCKAISNLLINSFCNQSVIAESHEFIKGNRDEYIQSTRMRESIPTDFGIRENSDEIKDAIKRAKEREKHPERFYD